MIISESVFTIITREPLSTQIVVICPVRPIIVLGGNKKSTPGHSVRHWSAI